ncbi:bifunctional diguanylate cyclase/phosphodiesterase [Formivibrio citricus]|nr:EAL domain-containing protein [Formivibrio citricus]
MFRSSDWRAGLLLGGGLLLMALLSKVAGFLFCDMLFVCPLIGLMAVLMLLNGVHYSLFFVPVALAVPLLRGFSGQAAVWLALVSVGTAALGAWLLKSLLSSPRIRLREAASHLVLGGAGLMLLSTLLGGLIPGGYLILSSDMPAWHRFFSFWSSDLVGFLVMVPLVLSMREGWRPAFRQRFLELMLAVMACAAGACLIYSLEGPNPSGWQFLLLPVAIWAALRIGQTGAALVALTLAFSLTHSLAGVYSVAILPAQLFLLMVTVTGVLLAASSDEEENSRRELAAERHKLDAILNAMPNPVFFEDVEGRLVYANQSLLQLVGGQNRNLAGFPSAPLREHLGLPALTSAQQSCSFECTVNAQTAPRTLMCNQQPLLDLDGKLLGNCFVATDMSERLVAEQQLRLSAQVFENASEGIVITDVVGRIIAVNPAFTRITGFAPEEAIGKMCATFRQIAQGTVFGQEVENSLRDLGSWQGEIPGWRKSGETYPAWGSISNVCDESGRITHRVAVFSDFSARKEAESRLQFLAQRDPLTQLFNRSSLQERLEQVCCGDGRLAVLFIDLDRFKTVNDTLGHAVGDELLQVIAQRLCHCLKERDFIARFGGDEFMVILEETLPDAGLATIARRIIDEIARPCAVRGHELFVTCSIGISRFPVDAKDSSGLMQAADLAMYRAKDMGKNTFAFHSQEMIAQVFERGRMEGCLHTAVAQSQFVLHYQPQFVLAGEEFHGVEALIRWQHPELGMVPPGSFIPLAEETGIIEIIGEWAIREACRQMRTWLDEGIDVRCIAVNLSPRQFRRGHLLDIVCSALDESGLEGERLELEITENALMENPENASAVLAELREMGVRIAIDDFGSGYSSLSYLKQFPLDTLKIDRSFISPLPEDGDMAAIVEAIVEMATKLRLTVVAEGVENSTQSSYLRHIGCTVAQGYHYSKPLAADLLPKSVRQVLDMGSAL